MDYPDIRTLDFSLYDEVIPALEYVLKEPNPDLPTEIVIFQSRGEYHMGWSENKVLHRLEKPALLSFDSKTQVPLVTRFYYHGKLHRENGPAYISGTNEVWYKHGQIHRTDGPAAIADNVDFDWYVNGNLIPEIRSFLESNKMKADQLSKDDLMILRLTFKELNSG